MEDELLTPSVAFHAHQAVEKSFKAILESYGVRVPKTHDLEKLYGVIQEIGIEFNGVDEDLLSQINDVYVDSRYPSDVGLIPDGIPSVKKVTFFYSLAKQVYEKTVAALEFEG